MAVPDRYRMPQDKRAGHWRFIDRWNRVVAVPFRRVFVEEKSWTFAKRIRGEQLESGQQIRFTIPENVTDEMKKTMPIPLPPSVIVMITVSKVEWKGTAEELEKELEEAGIDVP